MALTLSEAEAIADEVRKAGVVFMMGFNRRFSPLGRKAKALLEGRHPPFALLYRMEDSLCTLEWVLDPKIGGGRILSESCHLFDFMGWLNGAPPVRLFARGGALTHPHLDTQDNLAAAVEFANGSIGTILHGDLGISSYPKERIEIFCNMAAIVIDNFQRLQVAGIDGEGEMHLESVDKGWRQELDALADAIREGSPSPVGVEAGLTSMRCCLAAIESIRTGRAQTLAE